MNRFQFVLLIICVAYLYGCSQALEDENINPQNFRNTSDSQSNGNYFDEFVDTSVLGLAGVEFRDQPLTSQTQLQTARFHSDFSGFELTGSSDSLSEINSRLGSAYQNEVACLEWDPTFNSQTEAQEECERINTVNNGKLSLQLSSFAGLSQVVSGQLSHCNPSLSNNELNQYLGGNCWFGSVNRMTCIGTREKTSGVWVYDVAGSACEIESINQFSANLIEDEFGQSNLVVYFRGRCEPFVFDTSDASQFQTFASENLEFKVTAQAFEVQACTP